VVKLTRDVPAIREEPAKDLPLPKLPKESPAKRAPKLDQALKLLAKTEITLANITQLKMYRGRVQGKVYQDLLDEIAAFLK
jgi:hypothetical protein